MQPMIAVSELAALPCHGSGVPRSFGEGNRKSKEMSNAGPNAWQDLIKATAVILSTAGAPNAPILVPANLIAAALAIPKCRFGAFTIIKEFRSQENEINAKTEVFQRAARE